MTQVNQTSGVTTPVPVIEVKMPADKKRRTHQLTDISVLGLLQVIGLLPFIATFLGFAGPLHWTLDLLTHFRFQYLVVLSVVAFLLVYLKHRRLAALYLVAITVNLLTILPMYWPTFVHVDPDKPQLKLMHFNVHTGNKDYDGMAKYISETKCDVVLIQELHPRMDERLRQMTDYHMVTSLPRHDSFGVGMLVRNDVSDLTVDQFECTDITEGRAKVPAILAHLTWQDKPIALMSLHTLPPYKPSYAKAHDTQLLEATNWVNRQHEPVILLGDLNATPWSSGMRQIFIRTTLRNSQQGFGVQASWPADGGIIGKIPIDHCLVSEDFAILDRHLGESHGSDHLPLFVTVQLRQ